MMQDALKGCPRDAPEGMLEAGEREGRRGRDMRGRRSLFGFTVE